jgi:xanthine dehydrogenase/oxidase
MPAKMALVFEPEEIFCSSDVRFFGQPVGIVLAKSHELANKAADLVEVLYEKGNLDSSFPSVSL